MSIPKIWITRKIHPEAMDLLASQTELDVWPLETPPDLDTFLEKAPHIDGILTLLSDPVTAQFIQAANNLRIISQMAVGYDNIDIDEATSRGIPVGHTPGVLTETTADFTWALLMAAARRLAEADRQVRHGIWKPWGPDVLSGLDIFGSTLGIVGLGRIGMAVARRAQGFSMQVLYYDRNRNQTLEQELGLEYCDLNTLLQKSDFISLHIYYSPEAHHLIGRQQFEQMKPTAILINTARGAVVDPEALTWALQTNKIAAAGLDVFDPEPIPPDHPILKLDNLVIAPHIASASRETRKKMAFIAAKNLLAGLAGQPLPFGANPQVYGR